MNYTFIKLIKYFQKLLNNGKYKCSTNLVVYCFKIDSIHWFALFPIVGASLKRSLISVTVLQAAKSRGTASIWPVMSNVAAAPAATSFATRALAFRLNLK